MNDNFSDAFKSIVPEAPSFDGWAEGARRKRRNRTRLVAGIAGAAAIAVMVPVALGLGSNAALIATPGESTSPSRQVVTPTPDPATDAPGAAACWDGPGQVRRATSEGATDGAVVAWLCGDAGVPTTSLGVVGPLEPLVVGVDDLVNFIQAQPEMPVDMACTAEYRLTYRIVLDYGDGSRHVVPGGLHGCGRISDGETVRTGGQGLLDLALDLWRAQRAVLSAPTDTTQIVDCPPEIDADGQLVPERTRDMLPMDPAEAVSGLVCTETTTGGLVRGEGGLLNDGLAGEIGDSLREGSLAISSEGLVSSWLTLVGAWGGHIVLQRTSDDRFQWFDRGTPMLWTPPGNLLAQIDGVPLADESPASPEPGATGSQTGGAHGCQGVTSKDVATSNLDHGTLPTPERVWLCDLNGEMSPGIRGLATPLEPLVLEGLVARAAGQFNALEYADSVPTCRADAGPSYLVVYEYAAGTRQVVRIELAGCREAVAGDQIRQGGAAYFDSLLAMWEEQRRVVQPVQARPGPLCPQLSSVIDLDPSAVEFVGGSACVGWENGVEGTQEKGREIPLSLDLLAELTAQLDPQPGDVDFGRIPGDSLVLLTTAGDPITLLRLEDGRLLVRGVTEGGLWTPTGAAANELMAIFGQ